MTQTAVLPDVEKETTESDGYAHFVRTRSLLQGGVVVALCGKKYIPTNVGATVLDLPVCSPCAQLFSLLD